MSDFDVIIVGGGIAGASLGAAVAGTKRTLILEAEDQCGYHTTGRSAAFWLAHYGGPEVMPLTLASGPLLDQGWPTGERSWLRRRGAITIARNYMDLREALAANSLDAPLSELKRDALEARIPGLRGGWGLDKQILYLRSRSGDVYRYFKFEAAEFQTFLNAESRGRFFLAHIRDRCRCERMAKLRAA